MNQPTEACPVCGAQESTPFFAASEVPVTCASIFSHQADALGVPTGDVQLAACHQCSFVFNSAFDVALGEAGARYESSQAASAHFAAYARSLADDWVNRYQLSGKVVLEIGSGSGAFLKQLIASGIASAIAVDPLANENADARSSILVIADKFDHAQVNLAADALVCRHTLEHIRDVLEFLRSVHTWASLSRERVVLFELPDSRRIFAERAFWDVYYEHCNYFTAESLLLAFELAGFEILRIARVYDDQYLLVEAKARRVGSTHCTWPDAASARAQCLEFGKEVNESIDHCQAALRTLAAEGAPLVLWQGASKTVGFLSALADRQCIDSAVDLSVARQGKFLPGSGLPVHAPEKLVELQPKHVVLMNPVYLNEVTTHVRGLGLTTHVHTVNELLA